MNRLKQIPLIIPALCLLAFINCSNNPTSASSHNAQNTDLQNRVTAISAVVSNLRGLNFVRPVHVGVITRAQYSQNTAQSIGNSFSSLEQAALSKEYLQMGCLSETDTPIGQILTDYYSGFPAAYYVPGTDSLYILTDAYSNDTELNVYISHELTHALQDQHLGMNFTVFPGYSYYNDDANLAQTSLLEGDASFIEYTYLISTYYSSNGDNPFSDAETLSRYIKDDFLTANDTTMSPFSSASRGICPTTWAWHTLQRSIRPRRNGMPSMPSIQYLPCRVPAPKSIWGPRLHRGILILTRSKPCWCRNPR
jgi:hypothetical protein